MRINRVEFLAKLETLQPGLSPQEVIEQSACIVFKNGYAYSFNDEICVRAKSPLKIEGAVAAQPLLELLRKMPEDEIDVSPRDNELRLEGKRRRGGIRFETEIALPLDAVETPETWAALHGEFCEAISTVEACAGKDESKFYLTCVHIGRKFVEACDNLQAARYRVRTGFAGSALVRRDSIRHIIAHGATEFSETKSWVHFRNPARTVLSMRRFDEEYPDLDKKGVFEFAGEKAKLPRGLADAIERADVFASQNAETETVGVALKPGTLTLRADSALGWFSESKSVDYSGRGVAFLITPKILRAVVEKHPDCVLSAERLKVDTGKFTYVAWLCPPDQLAKGDNGGTQENEGEKTRRKEK